MGKVAFFILCFFHAIKINAMLEIIKQKVNGTKPHLSKSRKDKYIVVLITTRQIDHV